MTGKPAVRALEAFMVRAEGKEMVALRDPQRFSDEVVMVSPEAFVILSRLDGSRTLPDVQAEILRATGQIVPSSAIEEMLATLDRCHLLENDRFHARKQELLRAFAEARARRAAHAGEAYPAPAAELSRVLDGYFERAASQQDDGVLAGGASALLVLPPGVERPEVPEETGRVRGLIAPHIDPRRGGACMAKAYRLAARSPADLYVVFGTAHGDCEAPYCVTRKGYETPLGVAETDVELVDALVGSCGPEVIADEPAHRIEHSIEFQVVFLQHALRGKPFRILPVLCGSLHRALLQGVSPDAADLRVSRFHLALAAAVVKSGRSVCFVAGADLSHIGQRFGDPAAPDPKMLAETERHDRAVLAAAASADAAGVWQTVAADRDAHRVCGYPPIYALARATPGAKGRLLRYEQSLESETGSMVSFASMVLR